LNKNFKKMESKNILWEKNENENPNYDNKFTNFLKKIDKNFKLIQIRNFNRFDSSINNNSLKNNNIDNETSNKKTYKKKYFLIEKIHK
jgi:hypothetical protein